MKANIHTATVLTENIGANGPFHGHELRLTIGLIVKNEEKDLDKCLSSLKPLLEAVPSELIITDTGSTDRTVEIAQKYTDHMIHFAWCDDFSAARNTGLDAARGEWFLYLDGDEWFDDVTELVGFFNSGECDRYGSAAYIQRNYLNRMGDKYSDYFALRITRVNPQIRFVSKIHECLPIVEPTKMLSCFVHHFGYVYSSEEEREEKFERNHKLLKKQLLENPNDLRIHNEMCLQYLAEDQWDLTIEEAQKAMKIPEEKPEKQWKLMLEVCLFRALFRKGDYQQIVHRMAQSMEKAGQFEIYHIEEFYFAQLAAFHLKQYEKAIDFGDRCLALHSDFDAHKLDESMLMFIDTENISPKAKQEVLLTQVRCEVAQKDAKKALEYLKQVEIPVNGSSGSEVFQLYAAVAELSGNWGLIGELYLKVIPDGRKKHSFLQYAESNLMTDKKKREPAVQALAALSPEFEDGYVLLNRLRAAEDEGDRKKSAAILDSLSRMEEQWSSDYADVLWYVLKEKANMLPFLPHMDTDVIPAMTAVMQRTHRDYSCAAGAYFEAYSFENAKALFCAACLLERAVLSQNAKENAEFFRKLIAAYLDNLSKFVRAVYKPEILTKAGLSALPRSYRFGYYAGLALDAKRMGNDAAYLEDLRFGLKEYPVMKECVDFLLKDFEEDKKKRDEQEKEFSALAKQVKQNIEQLIAQGDLEQAGAYTLQLAKLIPEDDDIRRYRKLTHTEPTMAELASHLPQ